MKFSISYPLPSAPIEASWEPTYWFAQALRERSVPSFSDRYRTTCKAFHQAFQGGKLTKAKTGEKKNSTIDEIRIHLFILARRLQTSHLERGRIKRLQIKKKCDRKSRQTDQFGRTIWSICIPSGWWCGWEGGLQWWVWSPLVCHFQPRKTQQTETDMIFPFHWWLNELDRFPLRENSMFTVQKETIIYLYNLPVEKAQSKKIGWALDQLVMQLASEQRVLVEDSSKQQATKTFNILWLKALLELEHRKLFHL